MPHVKMKIVYTVKMETSNVINATELSYVIYA